MKNAGLWILGGVAIAGYFWLKNKSDNTELSKMNAYTNYDVSAPKSLPTPLAVPDASVTGFLKYEADKFLNIF